MGPITTAASKLDQAHAAAARGTRQQIEAEGPLQQGRRLHPAATLALCAFILLVVLVSCAAPLLRRAMRIEPTQALRADG